MYPRLGDVLLALGGMLVPVWAHFSGEPLGVVLVLVLAVVLVEGAIFLKSRGQNRWGTRCLVGFAALMAAFLCWSFVTGA